MEAEEKAAEAIDRQTTQEPEPEVTAVAVRRPAPIQAADSGVLVGSTFEEQYRLARAYFASGLMPEALNSPEKVLVAIQLCRELSLPPMASVGKICVINGTPSIFGDLPLALVQRSGKLEWIKEWLFDEKGDVLDASKPLPQFFGAVCEVKRRGQEAVKRVFTVLDAQKAGIWGKKVWAVHPKRMMQMRSRGWALKDAFADVLMGVSIAEYDHDELPGARGAVKQLTVADEINQTYAGEAPKESGVAQ